MGVLTVEGIYRDGKIELREQPELQGAETPVLVTFLVGLTPSATPDGSNDQDREARRQRAFARMEHGFHLGGSPYPSREELHDRDEDACTRAG